MQLLVSVRDASEAAAALQGGATVIDVKEPSRGSLGAADTDVMARVVDEVAGRASVSAALGELLELPGRAHKIPSDVSFAKIGLSGCGQVADWGYRWASCLAELPPELRAVGVVYADWRRASAPPPEAVIEQASRLGCAAILFDTFDKQSGDLFAHFTSRQLEELVKGSRRARLSVVLAGSLTCETLPRAIGLGPELVAVRGAACRSGRNGTVDSTLVQQLRALLPQENVQQSVPMVDISGRLPNT